MALHNAVVRKNFVKKQSFHHNGVFFVKN